MPLGRRKQMVRGASFPAGSLPFFVPAPSRRVGVNVTVAWHLALGAILPVADETIEQCGDGSTRGWRLELTTTGAIRFTVYRAGPANTALSSSNVLTVADVGLNFLAIASISGVSMRVLLNETETTGAAGGAMVTPTAADSLILGARTTGGTSPVTQAQLIRRWQSHAVGVGALSLDTLYQRTKDALRLEEPPGCVSYIDFGRYIPDLSGTTLGGTAGHFGDDVTGARIVNQGGPPIPANVLVRADRDADWSAA